MSKIHPFFEKFIIFWFPVIVWAFLIFTFSSTALPKIGPTYWPDFFAKKTAHVIEYAILSILLYRALKNSGVKKEKAMIYSVLVAFVYAITDEMHQSFIPVRTPKVRDVIIDTLGAGFSVFCVWKLLPKAPRKLKDLAESFHL